MLVLRTGTISPWCLFPLSWFNVARRPNPRARGQQPGRNQVVAKSPPQVANTDTFEDRFPSPQFREQFPSAGESLLQRQMSDFSPKRAVQQQPGPGVLQGCVAGATGSRYPKRPHPERPDDARQPEVVRLPILRQQSGLGGAVPQHLQGRPPRPPQLFGAASTGRTRPTMTAACWCTSPSISTCASRA